jgi:hypothetical protein
MIISILDSVEAERRLVGGEMALQPNQATTFRGSDAFESGTGPSEHGQGD